MQNFGSMRPAKLFLQLFQEKLGFSDAIEMERAHRVGEKDKERYLAQASNPDDGQRPRPIVARISSWKTKRTYSQGGKVQKAKRSSFPE